ncbi:hypothetical protein [Dokdonella sp.]|uniref:hypothetical protein n=1 Tax=Dokdonella sp. TaxID=2291710 RepID=UPI002F3F4BF7
MREVQAYDYNLRNAERYGSSAAEMDFMSYQRNRYYGNPSRANQQLVSRGIYHAPGW